MIQKVEYNGKNYLMNLKNLKIKTNKYNKTINIMINKKQKK